MFGLCAYSAVLIFHFIGTIGARQPDIDINRVRLLPNEDPRFDSYYSHIRRSIDSKHYRNNDYDNYSSGIRLPQTPIRFVHDASSSPDEKTIKIHQPREDPRLFYQSDAYIKENNRKKINNEVSSVYPGREVVRASDKGHMPVRLLDREQNLIEGLNLCVRCPHDRTLIAKAGADRVLLQSPRLLSCSGHKAPRYVHFSHMYGPKFGSLLDQGSHIVVGRLMYKSKVLHLCKMQVHVVVQSCVAPRYLISQCSDGNNTCTFKCRDQRLELQGESTLTCGSNMKWEGNLPVCRARTWCDPPPPPDHGHVSCKGATGGSGPGMAEGSRCRVRCDKGYRWTSRAVAVCRRGSWTHGLMCQPKRNI